MAGTIRRTPRGTTRSWRASRSARSSPSTARIELVEYEPRWPLLYDREEARIRAALGGGVIRIEHAGSTSVPGLPAKAVNLHVFTAGCDEVSKMLAFRDRLREDEGGRELYATAKRDLAARE